VIKKTQPRPSLFLLFVMMLASQLALTIFLPAVVNMAEDLGTSLNHIQLIIPAYLGAFAIMQLVAGSLSDTFGRRPIILCGLALFTLASFLCGLADNIEQLLIGRFFQAMGACTTIVVGRAIVRDGSEGKAAARALSYLGMSLAVGPAVAPFFGGFLVSWFDWRATFFSTAILGLATLITAIPRFVETLPKEDRRSPDLAGTLRKYVELLHNRIFLGYSLTIAFLTGTFQTFIVAAPIVMIDQMNVSPELFGFYVMTVPSSFILASFVSARLSGHVPLDKMIATGCIIALAGGLIQLGYSVFGSSSPASILIAILISNFGTGLAFANCYAQAFSMVQPYVAGAASALTGFIHMGWAFIISFVLANIHNITTIHLGISQTATAVGSVIAFLFLVKLFHFKLKSE
jgi:DHA1 family bicyclomycin/chloramphenicol resistance-like MFS transporter